MNIQNPTNVVGVTTIVTEIATDTDTILAAQAVQGVGPFATVAALATAQAAITDIQTDLDEVQVVQATQGNVALAPAATALSTATWTAGRAANLDNLDATVSSRAVAATALSNVQWTNARAALVDNLDAAVSSRAASATALSNVQWTNARAALVDNLDAAISTRLSTSVNSVQTGTIAIGAGATSNTATITTVGAKAWCNKNGHLFSSNTGDYSSMFSDATLTNATTVTVTRSGNTFINTVRFVVIDPK